MLAEREYSWIQPIVISRSGSHFDAISAAAKASVMAYLDEPSKSLWVEWFASSFGKTVRRATVKEMARIEAHMFPLSAVDVGEARALGFAPVRYIDMEAAIRKLQVGEYNLPKEDHDELQSGAVIFLNAELGMSTGKSCAQAAHALFKLISSDSELCDVWKDSDCPISVVELPEDEFMALVQDSPSGVIHDAGHTEIEPGSMTAIAHWRV